MPKPKTSNVVLPESSDEDMDALNYEIISHSIKEINYEKPEWRSLKTVYFCWLIS